MGRTTYQLPAADASETVDRLPDVLRTFACVVEHHGTAIADGTWCARDAETYRTHGMALVRAVLSQLAHIDRQAKVTTMPGRKTA